MSDSNTKFLTIIIGLILLSVIFSSGCLEEDRSNQNENIDINNENANNNQSNIETTNLLNKTPYIVYDSAWETGSLTVVIFKDKTICFLNIGVDRYKNRTQDLNGSEIWYLLNFTGKYTYNQSKQNLKFYSSGIRIIDDTNYNKLMNNLNQSNYPNLKNDYPYNETHDSDGLDIVFKAFNKPIKEINIYDDGYHYEEEITDLILFLRFLDELISNYWGGYI